ncbi:MAG: hypothetical protein FIB04_06660 [Gammaproteobacteria bacterium]|nr:hypothetical protein [Gammaproteobacteria bacterium]
MSDLDLPGSRPTAVKVYAALLVLSAIFMALLGWSASAYYFPAACLLLQALLLWSGKGQALFKWIVLVNQLSGLVLILVLWLGDGLGRAKLDISGVALLVNLLCGGPLMAIWGGAMLPGLRRGRRLFRWFNPQTA